MTEIVIDFIKDAYKKISSNYKLSLSPTLNLVSGVLLLVLMISDFLELKIHSTEINYLKSISVECNHESLKTLMIVLTMMLYNFISFYVVLFVVEKICSKMNVGRKKENLLYEVVFSLNDLVEKISSLYAFAFVIVVNLMYFRDGSFVTTPLAIITYVAIFLRFADIVYIHYYLIISKNISKKINENNFQGDTNVN